MNFNPISKNNLGVAGTLILVIFLSQARIFDFMINTYMGRLLLIAIVLALSYANKVFGVISIFFIIVMFNQTNIDYLEGFEDNTKNDKKDQTTTDTSGENKKQNEETIENLKKKIVVATQAEQSSVQPEIEPMTEETTNTAPATEGFNILGMENEIKRGKNSNTIPVSNLTNTAEDALPYDPNTITESFSAF